MGNSSALTHQGHTAPSEPGEFRCERGIQILVEINDAKGVGTDDRYTCSVHEISQSGLRLSALWVITLLETGIIFPS
ncbi:MAG: hypothetical protein AMK69_22845 [Nitrospira bacterium SG8_3]|nr:MAG: hypothetical protein AMK69_22845 [Nitrospira bacterium SG8_3]